jgi:type II secretion system protein N
MPEKLRQNLLLVGAYATFFWFAFAISAYFTFPYDRLRDFLTEKVANGFTLEIGELSPSWVTGVALDDVNLTRAATEPDGKPVTLHLDTLTLRVAPLSLLAGTENVSGSLAATLGEGEMHASVSNSEGTRQIEAELDAMDLHALGLGAWWGLPIKGAASGTIDVTLDAEPNKTAGNVELKVDGLRIGDGKSKIKVPGMMGGLTLSETHAGTLDSKITIADGVATIERLSTDGTDLKAKGNGTVGLAPQVGRSRLDILFDFTLTEAWKTKDEKNRTMLELLTTQGEWRRATDPDGTLHLHLGGTVSAMRAAPGTPSRVRSAARRGSKRTTAEPAAAPAEDK